MSFRASLSNEDLIQRLSHKESKLVSSNSKQELTNYEICINLASCTFQTVIGYLMLDIMLAISLHFIAQQLNPVDVAGTGLAYTICNVLLIPMGFGLNQSLNVHSAQALGSDKPKLAATYLNLTFYMHFIYFIPIGFLLYFLKTPFSYTIPEADRQATVDAAWKYLIPLITSSIFAIQFESFKSYLIACQVFTPFSFIHVSTTLLHIFWCWLLIIKLDWGIWGAGLAINIAEISNCLILGIYIPLSRFKEHFSQFNLNFVLWKKRGLFVSYVKSSAPIVIHIFADFFVFFLLTFLSMSLGTNDLNAQLAFSNTSAFYFRMPISLSLGLMTYVGSEMGLKRVKNAKRYTIVGYLLFLCFATVVISLIWFCRKQWAEFYAKEEDIQNIMLENLLLFLFGCLIVDGSQGAISGALKGINNANLVTYSTLISYYVFGIPMICYLTFGWGLGWRLKGIWLGFGFCNVVLCVLFALQLFLSDWEKQAELIHERLEKQNHLQENKESLVHQAHQEDETGEYEEYRE